MQPITTVAPGDVSFQIPVPHEGLTYQWQVDTSGTGEQFADIADANKAVLELKGVTQENKGYKYRVLVAIEGNKPYYSSNAAELTVYSPAELQPVSIAVKAGDDATFSVPAAGEGLTYQWQVKTNSTFTAIEGETNFKLVLHAVSKEMDGNKYRVVIGGVLRSEFTSEAAVLTVGSVPGMPSNVTAVAGNGNAIVSFTPPTDGGGSPITAYVVTASPGGLTATGLGSPITISGLTNGTAYTFTVAATNATGTSKSSAASSAVTPYGEASPPLTTPKPPQNEDVNVTPDVPVSTPTTTPAPSKNEDVEVWVNGKVEYAGKATASQRSGQSIITIAVDEKKLEERLAAVGEHAIITIPVLKDADIVIGELNGKMIKSMERQLAIIEIRTEQASYSLPAQRMNIDAISAKFGQTISLEDIKVHIEISAARAQDTRNVDKAAAHGQFTPVIPALEFKVNAMYGDSVIDVTRFDSYVERTITIPDGIDPNKITTGIVVDSEGNSRHVPTKVVMENGHYYAKINSLTNSLYSVVWHPLEFSDMTKHWAKEAVNDMGSRMVIEGIGDGKFDPDRDVTRAEFTEILVRGLGLKPETSTSSFTDVKMSDWYNGAINTAYAYHLVSGSDYGNFRPNAKITRQEAMTIISRAMKTSQLAAKLPDQGASAVLRPFHDAAGAAAWAVTGMAETIQAGVVSGRSSTMLAPKENLTRAESATIMRRFLQKSNSLI